MNAVSYTKARQCFAQVMDSVCADHEPLIVTRQKSESVVVISLEDYQSLEETAYLLRAPKNARRLIDSILELESGEGKSRKLTE